jgi:uncharacterized membrane protein YdjX (TVP38/TMEM64 family)
MTCDRSVESDVSAGAACPPVSHPVSARIAWRRAAGALLVCVLLAVMASVGVLQTLMQEFLITAQPALQRHPLVGALALIGVAAIGAMAAFVSVAVLVPLAVLIWGEVGTMLMVWMGWILGGITAYALAWHLGRRVLAWCGARTFVQRCESRVSPDTAFILVLLLQLALPSEIPGYLLGLVRYPVRRYLAALALAELPYAVATIYLGSSFLEQRSLAILGIGMAVALLSLLAAHWLRRELGSRRD